MRDIIESAKECAARPDCDEGCSGWGDRDACFSLCVNRADTGAFATELALMEAVVEAVERAGANYWRVGDECRAWHNDVDAVADVRSSVDALTAYRRERALRGGA